MRAYLGLCCCVDVCLLERLLCAEITQEPDISEYEHQRTVLPFKVGSSLGFLFKVDLI